MDNDNFVEIVELIRQAMKRTAELPKGAVAYTYDGNGELTNLTVARRQGVLEHYVFDEAGNGTSVIEIPERLFRQGKPKKVLAHD